MELVPDVVDRLRAAGVTAAVVVGGIIPPDDAEILLGKGVAAVYTPKDFEFKEIMEDLVALAERHKLPVHFIGVGEGIDDLAAFTARDFAQAIAGIES